MKKWIALIVSAAILLCLTACGSSGEPAGTTEQLPAEEGSSTGLQFEKGTNKALCPICEKKVEWMGLTQEYVDTIRVTDDNGELIDSAIMSGTVFESRHYYLAEDLTYNDSPVMGFFRGPGKGLTSCLHLNDHNITTPATTSIFGNSGVLNVMGNGIVTGYSPNLTEGAAVRNGNRNANNGLNLYGGTYKKTAETSADSPVVAFDGAGRCVSVYEGVVIDGGTGVAVFADSSAAREKEGFLLLQDCTVFGDVKLADLDVFATRAEIRNCKVKGTVTIPQGHLLTLFGKVEIDKLTLGEEVRLTAGELLDGSKITVDATGIFTGKLEAPDAYTGYFLPADPAKKITVQENALCCE